MLWLVPKKVERRSNTMKKLPNKQYKCYKCGKMVNQVYQDMLVRKVTWLCIKCLKESKK